MKGLAPRTIVLLILALIVLAFAGYFGYIAGQQLLCDPLNPSPWCFGVSNEKQRFLRYAICSLTISAKDNPQIGGCDGELMQAIWLDNPDQKCSEVCKTIDEHATFTFIPKDDIILEAKDMEKLDLGFTSRLFTDIGLDFPINYVGWYSNYFCELTTGTIKESGSSFALPDVETSRCESFEGKIATPRLMTFPLEFAYTDDERRPRCLDLSDYPDPVRHPEIPSPTSPNPVKFSSKCILPKDIEYKIFSTKDFSRFVFLSTGESYYDLSPFLDCPSVWICEISQICKQAENSIRSCAILPEDLCTTDRGCEWVASAPPVTGDPGTPTTSPTGFCQGEIKPCEEYTIAQCNSEPACELKNIR